MYNIRFLETHQIAQITFFFQCRRSGGEPDRQVKFNAAENCFLCSSSEKFRRREGAREKECVKSTKWKKISQIIHFTSFSGLFNLSSAFCFKVSCWFAYSSVVCVLRSDMFTFVSENLRLKQELNCLFISFPPKNNLISMLASLQLC